MRSWEIVVESFGEDGSMRVRMDGYASGKCESRLVLLPGSPANAADQVEELAGSLAKMLRVQAGAGVHRG
jgi:hypothetical protein